jgi:hypothetical protein
MVDDFDAYYLWLGIPPDEQPPDHYRLLGVRRFESNGDVIEAAADRQMGHVQRYKIGAHSALSQQLLNQLASAKICLLKTESKAEYDRQLRERVAPVASQPAVVPAATAVPQPSVPRAATPIRVVPLPTAEPLRAAEPWTVEPSRSTRARVTPARSMPSKALLAVGIATLIVLFGVVIRWNSENSAPEEPSLAARDESTTPVASPPAETAQPPVSAPEKLADATESPATPIAAIAAAIPEPPPATPPAEPASPSVAEPPAKPTSSALSPQERAAAEQFLQAGGRLSLLVDGQPGEAGRIEDLPARCAIVGTIVIPESLRNDAGMEIIRQFNQLAHLNLEYSGVTDAGLSRLTNLKHLVSLHMYRAPVTDEGLKSVAQMTAIEQLSLNSTRITNAGLAHLKSLKKLQHLGLGEIPPITGQGLAHLSGLKSLVSLDLNVTGVNDHDLELLGGWSQLKSLNLFTTPVTDAGLVQLYRLENLEATELGRTGVTDAGVAALQMALPKCRISRIP